MTLTLTHSCTNTVCSHYVTSAMLVERYNEKSAILEEEINPVGGKLLFYANTFFCFRKKYMVAGTHSIALCYLLYMLTFTMVMVMTYCSFNRKEKQFPVGVLPIMAYTGTLRPKGVPFSGFRYIKG